MMGESAGSQSRVWRTISILVLIPPAWPWKYREWVSCIQPQPMLSKEEVRVVLLRAGRERGQESGEMEFDSHGHEFCAVIFVTCIALGGIS